MTETQLTPFDSVRGPVDDLIANGTAEEGISSDALRGLFRDHPAGVAVITATSAEGPVAMTASSLFSVSVAPPLLVFSASDMSSSTPSLLAADTVVIHLIDRASQHIAVLGATGGVDRFADAAQWSVLPTGEPYFVEPRRRIRGRIVKKIDVGAATLLIVHAIEAWHESGDEPVPLVYHNRTWHTLSEKSQLS
jgi:flavin reductase (DIM6/NTAB) family NADH-FMN oxidoreductase RutF